MYIIVYYIITRSLITLLLVFLRRLVVALLQAQRRALVPYLQRRKLREELLLHNTPVLRQTVTIIRQNLNLRLSPYVAMLSSGRARLQLLLQIHDHLVPVRLFLSTVFYLIQ